MGVHPAALDQPAHSVVGPVVFARVDAGRTPPTATSPDAIKEQLQDGYQAGNAEKSNQWKDAEAAQEPKTAYQWREDKEMMEVVFTKEAIKDKKGVKVVFKANSVSVKINGSELLFDCPRLMGQCDADECTWTLTETKHLQLHLAKLDENTWKGVEAE